MQEHRQCEITRLFSARFFRFRARHYARRVPDPATDERELGGEEEVTLDSNGSCVTRWKEAEGELSARERWWRNRRFYLF